MAYEQRDNSGSLFKNDRREKDSHPTHTGTIMVDGKEYWLSAWTKEANGKRFFSLAVKPKEQRAAPVDRQQQQREFYDRAQSPDGRGSGYQGGGSSGGPDLDDDVPFAPEWR